MALNMVAHPMESPALYRLWQAPFARRKLRPFLAGGAASSFRRVLDVGCGPGTNASYFDRCEYLGLDINPRYIATARRLYGERFMVADVTALDTQAVGGEWDCILINSLLHHLPDDAVEDLLSKVVSLLGHGGEVHILDLVLPEERRLPWILARLDRGSYPRLLEHWQSLFLRHLAIQRFTPYSLGLGRVRMWSMVYCVAQRRAQ
jgi:SAM-dependent methyltransferase